jgi:MFS family permease
MGDGFHSVALAIWVLTSTGSAKAMSAVLVTRILVSVLTGTVGGTIADRVDRHRLMWALDLLRGATVAVIAYLVRINGPFPLVLALTAVLALIGQVRSPAFSASLLYIVGKEHVQRAGAWIQVTSTLARVVGPLLGGATVAGLGGWVALSVDALSFLLSALLVLVAGTFPSPARDGQEQIGFWQDLLSGLACFRKNPFVAAIAVYVVCLNFFAYAATVLLPVLAVKVWNASPLEFGALQGVFPLGLALGGMIILTMGKRLRRRGIWMAGSAIATGPLLGLLGYVPQALQALPLLLLVGLTLAFVSILAQVALQTEVDAEVQGRVFGTLDSLGNVATPLAMSLAGVLADAVGAQPAQILVGVCTFLVGVLSLTLLHGLRKFD